MNLIYICTGFAQRAHWCVASSTHHCSGGALLHGQLKSRDECRCEGVHGPVAGPQFPVRAKPTEEGVEHHVEWSQCHCGWMESFLCAGDRLSKENNLKISGSSVLIYPSRSAFWNFVVDSRRVRGFRTERLDSSVYVSQSSPRQQNNLLDEIQGRTQALETQPKNVQACSLPCSGYKSHSR